MSASLTRDATEAARCLAAGGLVAIPTETVYGLAARALDETAVARVYAVKNRPVDHPLIVHLAPSADPSRWGRFDDNALALAAAFWPGPLTLLVPRTSVVPDWVTGGRETVALRVPRHQLTIDMLEILGDAVVAPSANTFGHVSPTTPAHVLADLGDAIDLVLDGGACDVGIESTIVECSPEGLQILRPGAIDAPQIESATGVRPGELTGGARAPGMLASHYAPRAQVVLVASDLEANAAATDLRGRSHIVAIVQHDNVADYARNLYADLRAADANGADVIVAVLPHGDGLAPAIADRLRKAAAGR